MFDLFQYVAFKVPCNTELPDLSRHREGAPSGSSVLDGQVLNMEPVLKPQPKLLSLDNNLLLTVARANFLSQITVSSLVGEVEPLRIHSFPRNKLHILWCQTFRC